MSSRNRKSVIANELADLAAEAKALKQRGEDEPVGIGQTAYTNAVAANHVATVKLKRELGGIIRHESQT